MADMSAPGFQRLAGQGKPAALAVAAGRVPWLEDVCDGGLGDAGPIILDDNAQVT